MRIGQNVTPQPFLRVTSSSQRPVSSVQPVQKVELPLQSYETTVYKPKDFNITSYLFPKGIEWNIFINEPYLVLLSQRVFEMVFKLQDFLSNGGVRLEVSTKHDTKNLKPYTAVAAESSERVSFYPFGGKANVDLNPQESFGIKFGNREDLIYAIQFNGMHEQDPSLVEVTLHLTNKLV